MQSNADKCEVLQFTKKKNPTICNYSLHDQHLQTVKQAKYLGATISSDLSWKQHVDNTEESNQQPQFPQAEHPGPSTIGKGTVLQDPGLSDYAVCVNCLGPLYKYQHQEA